MRKILLSLLFVLGCISYSSAQTYSKTESTVQRVISQTFDDVVFGNLQSPSYIHFSVYVTRETIINDPLFAYRYQIMVVNHSKYLYNNTSLYMSGIKTYANGDLISGAYPKGFWAIIPYEQPVSIYWYKTNQSVQNFGITWEDIRYY